MSTYQHALSLQDRKILVKELKTIVPNAMPMVLNINKTYKKYFIKNPNQWNIARLEDAINRHCKPIHPIDLFVHDKKIPNEDLLSIYLRFQDTDGNLYVTCLEKQEEDYIIVPF